MTRSVAEMRNFAFLIEGALRNNEIIRAFELLKPLQEGLVAMDEATLSNVDQSDLQETGK